MTKAEFIMLCEKHNAQTIFKNQVELSPVGAFWESQDVDDIPDDVTAFPVIFDVTSFDFDVSGVFSVRAYAPESWFPNKHAFREFPF